MKHFHGSHKYTDSEMELSFKRSYDYQCRSYSSIHLSLSKMSRKSVSYLSHQVRSRLDVQHRSHDFRIIDVYYSYVNFIDRKLVVVIKHDDKSYSEAFYLK